ncbi:O-antigen ligase family protein [Geobacillus zalihae]|uniref:O-antigen ligase family protein n=1 Tax=Geobacillus zalihae TaxID=213419 RepID=UPI001680DE16|nr:O-antigen ligase family protein [Geobacillus zalihae]QNU23479.1 oligosaccharide repeat unit polymerase [Geobacillus zalihae]
MAIKINANYIQLLLVIILAIIIGYFVSTNIFVSLLPLACLLAILLLISNVARLAFLVFGSIFVLQSSSNWTPIKTVFLIGIILISLVSLLKVTDKIFKNIYKDLKPVIISSIILNIYIILSIVLSIYVWKVSPIVAVREAYPYLIFSFVPILAIDFSDNINKRPLYLIFYSSGILSSSIFCLSWLSKRDYINVSTEEIGLASMLLPLAFFSYSCSRVLYGKKNKVMWLMISAFVLSSLLVTGTRTSIIALIMPFFVAVIRKDNRLKRIVQLITFYILLITLIIVGVLVISKLTQSKLDIITERFLNLKDMFITGGLTEDQSYNGRYEQTLIAIQAIKFSPFLGAGLGTGFYQVTNYVGSMDSPLASVAKLGIIGLVLLVTPIVNIGILLLKEYKRKKIDYDCLSLFGYLVIIFLYSLILPPYEEKGFGIGLLLLLTLFFGNRYSTFKDDKG